MKTIWKWRAEDGFQAYIHGGAVVLSVTVDSDVPFMWAMVDPEMGREQWTFRVYGEGSVMPDEPGRYCGSFQWPADGSVFHVFAEVK